MPSSVIACLLLLAAYLVGSIPFGYLFGRLRGVDLFREGSGNIGATNAGRVLGRKVGLLVFLLDFLKGAFPVATIEPLARTIDPGLPESIELPSALPVGAAVATFLGHLYPVTLGFRGGKGVATGAGTVAVLVPGPFLVALATWALVVMVSRTVSAGSLSAVAGLVMARLLGTSHAFGISAVAVTSYCLLGGLLVLVKHRTNLYRLIAGTENRIGDSQMRMSLLRVLHLLAVGFWFGGAGFFNFIVAPSIFRSFGDVVATSPSDRTAGMDIVPPGTPEGRKVDLSRALAGAAVGPIFPSYFVMQAVCGFVAVATAWAWRRAETGRRVHRLRIGIVTFGWMTALVGWPLSNYVSELRLNRFDPNPDVAAAATAAFGGVHLISLGLSVVTVSLAGAAVALGAFLPRDEGKSAP